MKKFLSKVLTLALVCAIVVTGTSITSEAKGKKSSKKAVATTYSSNAVVNDFVATMIKSNGLVINGKSYNSQQALTLGFAADSAVTVSPMYWQDNGMTRHTDGSVVDIPRGRGCGFCLHEDGRTGDFGIIDGFRDDSYDFGTFSPEIYVSDIFEFDLGQMQAFDYTDFNDNAELNANGVWNTNAFIANGINTQYICSWMQSRGLNTSTDIYNYLVANGATFTVDTGLIAGADTTQMFVCVQCPYLHYEIDANGTRIFYNNSSLSGVNIVDVQSAMDGSTTQWYSGLQH